MRELVYYIAATLDGFIARQDGSFDDFPWDEAFIDALKASYPETLPAPMRPSSNRDQNLRFDAVLMGRATYEVGVKEGLTSPYPTLDQYVVSRSMSESPDPAVTLIRSDVAERVGELKAETGKAIWICGGSQLATTLFLAGLVDRVVLKSAPVFFGAGIPLFRDQVEGVSLRKETHRSFDSGYSITEFLVEQ